MSPKLAKKKPASKTKTLTTADRVAEITAHLEQLILSGKLKADDRLPPERELAEQWNVSRSGRA